MTGPTSARMVLRDPTVSVAILETARGGMLRAGLGYRAPDVACCLNVAADHLGLGGVDTLEQLAAVKRIPIEVARDTVVLNADDPLCVRMASHSRAKQVCYVTMHPSNALVREHIRAGGMAVALEAGVNGQMITIYDKGAHLPLLWTHLIPATLEGKALHNVQNAMFAAAMAHAMDLKLDDIRTGLRTFDTSYFQAPGRMNVSDHHGFRAIVDYGHNAAAVDAMCTLVDRMRPSMGAESRRLVVLAAPGDRRDEDIAAIGSRAASSFDHFVCREDDRRRGREPGEVPRLLAQALAAAGVEAERIECVPDEVQAVQRGLTLAKTGDLVLIFADQISRSWKQVIYFGGLEGESATPGQPRQLVEATPPDLESFDGLALLRDERGVIVQEEAD